MLHEYVQLKKPKKIYTAKHGISLEVEGIGKLKFNCFVNNIPNYFIIITNTNFWNGTQ